MNRVWLCLLLGIGVASASWAGPTATLDQNNPGISGDGVNDQNAEWQQQVTAGLGGVLAGVELYAVFEAETITLSIGEGPAFDPGPFVFTSQETILPGGSFIDTTAADIVLTPGEKFVIDISNANVGGSGDCAVTCDLLTSDLPYAGGDFYFKTGVVADVTGIEGASLAFETFVDDPAAPEPGSLLLLAGSLFPLVYIARRRLRRN